MLSESPILPLDFVDVCDVSDGNYGPPPTFNIEQNSAFNCTCRNPASNGDALDDSSIEDWFTRCGSIVAGDCSLTSFLYDGDDRYLEIAPGDIPEFQLFLIDYADTPPCPLLDCPAALAVDQKDLLCARSGDHGASSPILCDPIDVRYGVPLGPGAVRPCWRFLSASEDDFDFRLGYPFETSPCFDPAVCTYYYIDNSKNDCFGAPCDITWESANVNPYWENNLFIQDENMFLACNDCAPMDTCCCCYY
jgi:hypothetical protein